MNELRERPHVRRDCKKCVPSRRGRKVTTIVSPTGLAHIGLNDGQTACGHDATGNDWWWPV